MHHESWVSAASFSPDGRRIVTACGNEAKVWDAQSGKPVGNPLSRKSRVVAVSFSPDGRRIVTACGNEAEVWDAQSGKPLGEPMLHPGIMADVRTVNFSPDGWQIDTVSNDHTAQVWDAQS